MHPKWFARSAVSLFSQSLSSLGCQYLSAVNTLDDLHYWLQQTFHLLDCPLTFHSQIKMVTFKMVTPPTIDGRCPRSRGNHGWLCKDLNIPGNIALTLHLPFSTFFKMRTVWKRHITLSICSSLIQLLPEIKWRGREPPMLLKKETSFRDESSSDITHGVLGIPVRSWEALPLRVQACLFSNLNLT